MPENDLNEIDTKLLKEFSRRIVKGEHSAGLDLAQFFWSHLPSNEVNLYITVVETLIIQAAELGSKDSKKYLIDIWPDMKKVLTKRLIRRGFKNDWSV